MGPRHGRGSGGTRTAHGRPGLPAYGNNTTWREDDFRVAVIILLVATAWIILAFRKRRNGNKGWFEGLGFGFGPAAAPSFSRQVKGPLVHLRCGYVLTRESFSSTQQVERNESDAPHSSMIAPPR